MSSVKPFESREVVVQAHSDDKQMVRFIRAFVAMTEPVPDPDIDETVGTGPEQVLFDVDVDGDRYVLIKMVQVERNVLSLSPREREIVRMVALGRQNKVIAGALSISSWTVCTHLRRIFAKLGVTSRAAMVAKVAELEGVVELKETVETSAPRRPT
jgi:DNA-binding CsgD family transcriptional regulator